MSYASRYPDYTRIPALTMKASGWKPPLSHRYRGGCEGDERLYCADGTAAATRRKASDAARRVRCKPSARTKAGAGAFISVMAGSN